MSVPADRVAVALEQVAAGRWTPIGVPGLDVRWDGARARPPSTTSTVIRDGPGQLLVSVSVDDVLYATVAGDGLVVATPLGSSAYTMAAGGPILAPGAEGIAVTPLAPHGGVVTAARRRDRAAVDADDRAGPRRRPPRDRRAAGTHHGRSVAVLAPDYATLVRLAEEEPRLSGLRRRGLVQTARACSCARAGSVR